MTERMTWDERRKRKRDIAVAVLSKQMTEREAAYKFDLGEWYIKGIVRELRDSPEVKKRVRKLRGKVKREEDS